MLVWKPQYETGHPEIDREHKAIFEHLNQIGAALRTGAAPAQVTQMILFLQQYSLVHFQREEGVMACTGCAKHGANCAAHRQFEKRLEGWISILSSSGMPVSILEDIHTETCRWIEAHIAHVDVALRDHPVETVPR